MAEKILTEAQWDKIERERASLKLNKLEFLNHMKERLEKIIEGIEEAYLPKGCTLSDKIVIAETPSTETLKGIHRFTHKWGATL
jgi:hypothetical protein